MSLLEEDSKEEGSKFDALDTKFNINRMSFAASEVCMGSKSPQELRTRRLRVHKSCGHVVFSGL
eukprot:9108341-Pyramimonas_sp.AAC.1